MPALKTIWMIGQQPCGKRLATMMPEWVPEIGRLFVWPRYSPGPLKRPTI
jgi:hypothetical protein